LLRGPIHTRAIGRRGSSVSTLSENQTFICAHGGCRRPMMASTS
jgi:hypothetical protein